MSLIGVTCFPTKGHSSVLASQKPFQDSSRAPDGHGDSNAKKALHTARHRLNHFFLRHHRRFHGKSRWSTAHFEWLRKRHFEQPAQKRVLADYLE